MRFRGKVVLITGANRGIGRALSMQLARLGAKVALTGRQGDELRALQREIEACGGEAMHRVFDVSLDQDARSMIDDVDAALGRVDVLINNAGITLGGDIRLVSDEEWRHVFEVNFWGALRTARAVLPGMMKRGSGYIVNVASGAGLIVPALWTPYATSKFALVGLSEGLAGSLRRRGIRVSLVCPGWVDTEINQGPPPRLVRNEGRDAAGTMRAGIRWRSMVERLPGWNMSADTAARKIIRGLERERYLIYTHWWMRWIVLLHAAAPETFARFLDRVNAADEARHRAKERQ